MFLLSAPEPFCSVFITMCNQNCETKRTVLRLRCFCLVFSSSRCWSHKSTLFIWQSQNPFSFQFLFPPDAQNQYVSVKKKKCSWFSENEDLTLKGLNRKKKSEDASGEEGDHLEFESNWKTKQKAKMNLLLESKDYIQSSSSWSHRRCVC